jgi:penicillin-binding protein 1A
MGIAARAYFGKDVFDLSKAEITALVGIIQSPEYYSPGKNLEGLKKRQQTVVNLLEEQGLLTAQEGQAIFQEELAFEPFRQSLSAHPYYMTYLARQLEKELGAQKLYQGGLKIYTTIDNRMQKAAEYAVVKQAATFAARGLPPRMSLCGDRTSDGSRAGHGRRRGMGQKSDQHGGGTASARLSHQATLLCSSDQ